MNQSWRSRRLTWQMRGVAVLAWTVSVFGFWVAPVWAQNQAIPIKLLVVIYDPIIESSGGARLHDVLGWNDPNVLTDQLVADFATVSHGVVKYQVVNRIVRDEWPIHLNGKRYTDELYLKETAAHNWTLGSGDYLAIITDNAIRQKVTAGNVDEVWLWGGPGFGWWESAMAGNGAFWINGGPISGVNSKAFILMGLNYERGMAEAMESYGHRTESIMKRIYGSWEAAETHDWNRFTLLDRDKPGRGGIGNAHNAFNAEPGTDYNRSSEQMASTSADDWYKFPNMTWARTMKNCAAWGCDGYGYLKWWYDHMPHVGGLKKGLLNNWWRYIVDPNAYKSTWQFLPPAEVDFAEAIVLMTSPPQYSVDSWDCWAESATCTLSAELARKKRGGSSVKFTTTGAFDTAVQYPTSGTANWDLREKTYVTFWAYAENPNAAGFQNMSPVVYLFNSNGGYFKYVYQGDHDLMNDAIGNWKHFVIPLAGGDKWKRTKSGTVWLGNIDYLEIHNDTWGDGFTVFFDGVGFSSASTQDQGRPSVSITSPAKDAVVSGTIPITVSASDAFSIVLRVHLYVDGKYLAADAIAPFKFNWNTTKVANGPHVVKATAYDLFGNTKTAQVTVSVSN